MSRTLTASDRSALIKMAAALPAGSPDRKAILAGLRVAETPLEEQMFTHPKTKNKVKFTSLPKEEQAKIRSKMKGKSKDVDDKGKGKGALSWMQRTTGMSDGDMSKLKDAWKKNFDPKKSTSELLEILKKEEPELHAKIQKAKKRSPSGTLEALRQMAKSEGKSEGKSEEQKGGPKKKSKAELVKDYEKAIGESNMSAEDKKKALERAKDPKFDPGAALGAMGDEEATGKKASDRSRLIRLASSMPKGSEMRRAILAGLREAYGLSTVGGYSFLKVIPELRGDVRHRQGG